MNVLWVGGRAAALISVTLNAGTYMFNYAGKQSAGRYCTYIIVVAVHRVEKVAALFV